MLTQPLRCKVVPLVVLCAVLAAPSVSLGLLDRLWSFLTGVWSAEGCQIDPNGRCVTTLSPQTDTGCQIDPNGRCVS